jgi:hypothetical protein
MNTTIQYMHRTGDNYKSFKTVVVRGTLTLDQVKPLCYGPTPGCFKPEDLNLEYPDAAVETEDNPWCEFLNFLPTVHSDDLFPFYHPDDQAANLLHLLEETKRDHDRVEDDGGPTAEDLGHAPGEEADDFVAACPICGAEIQATEDLWLDRVCLSSNGREMVDYGSEEHGDVRIYCKNDHTQTEMMEVLSLARERRLNHK